MKDQDLWAQLYNGGLDFTFSIYADTSGLKPGDYQVQAILYENWDTPVGAPVTLTFTAKKVPTVKLKPTQNMKSSDDDIVLAFSKQLPAGTKLDSERVYLYNDTVKGRANNFSGCYVASVDAKKGTITLKVNNTTKEKYEIAYDVPAEDRSGWVGFYIDGINQPYKSKIKINVK